MFLIESGCLLSIFSIKSRLRSFLMGFDWVLIGVVMRVGGGLGFSSFFELSLGIGSGTLPSASTGSGTSSPSSSKEREEDFDSSYIMWLIALLSSSILALRAALFLSWSFTYLCIYLNRGHFLHLGSLSMCSQLGSQKLMALQIALTKMSVHFRSMTLSLCWTMYSTKQMGSFNWSVLFA